MAYDSDPSFRVLHALRIKGFAKVDVLSDLSAVDPDEVEQHLADFQTSEIALFREDADGRRPCFGGVQRMQDDPRWRDNLLFAEYFHGDDGAGLGAMHQTGWTGLVADVIRRRHGDVPSVGDLLRTLRDAKDES